MSSFADGIIIYVENPTELTKNTTFHMKDS